MSRFCARINPRYRKNLFLHLPAGLYKNYPIDCTYMETGSGMIGKLGPDRSKMCKYVYTNTTHMANVLRFTS